MFESRDNIERVSRMYAASVTLPDNRILCRVLRDTKMFCDARDISIMPHLAIDGFWESWITKRVADHVKPGMHCWVVGAHWGYYALLMARLGATVEAFEPNPRSFDLLEDNVSLNGLNIDCHKMALGQLDDTRLAIRHSYKWSGSSVVLDPLEPYDSVLNLASVTEVRTIDSFLDSVRLDFVFIDAERSEPFIWRGMAKTWERLPDMQVCLEALGNIDEKNALYELLAQTANVYRVNHDGGLTRILDASSLATVDMLWLKHK